MALCARLDNLDYRTYVLLGDGECAEGSVWEAASLAGIYKLNQPGRAHRCEPPRPKPANRLRPRHRACMKSGFAAFGWRTEVIDGHDMEEILEVLAAVGSGLTNRWRFWPRLTKAPAFRSCRTRRLARQGAYQKKRPPEPSPSCSPKPNPASAQPIPAPDRTRCSRRTKRRPASRPSITRRATWSRPVKPTELLWSASERRINELWRWTATPRIPPSRRSSQEISRAVRRMFYCRAEHGRRRHRLWAPEARSRSPRPSARFFTPRA